MLYILFVIYTWNILYTLYMLYMLYTLYILYILYVLYTLYIMYYLFCVLEVARQYMPVDHYGSVDEVNADQQTDEQFAKNYSKRKIGTFAKAHVHKTYSQAKRRRTKTYEVMMQLDNYLDFLTGSSLADFQIKEDDNGDLPDPYTWPVIHMAPDRGPDMNCLDHALSYEKQVNLSVDYDPPHESKNGGRGILKACNLWTHTMLMTSANNCFYGSTLSPPRQVQVREAIKAWIKRAGPDCPVLNMYMANIIRQLELPCSVTDPDAADVVKSTIQDHEILWVKGRKVNLGRYQQTVFHDRKNLKFFALRAYYLCIATYKLGLKVLIGLQGDQTKPDLEGQGAIHIWCNSSGPRRDNSKGDIMQHM